MLPQEIDKIVVDETIPQFAVLIKSVKSKQNHEFSLVRWYWELLSWLRSAESLLIGEEQLLFTIFQNCKLPSYLSKKKKSGEQSDTFHANWQKFTQ